jgi:hypothetical protein
LPEQIPFVAGNATVANDATAVSVLSLIQAIEPLVTGSCTGLNITFDTATYWGNDSAVTNTNGLLVAANTPALGSAVGWGSDTIPIARMFVFNHSGSTATGAIWATFIP